MKKAFTLIELLIVTVIIAIVVGATMRFNGQFVHDIYFKKEKDQIAGDYHIAVNHVLSSRYVFGSGYDILRIEIPYSGNHMAHRYLDEGGALIRQDLFNYDEVELTGFKRDDRETEGIRVDFVPYEVGCLSSDEKKDGVGDFLVRGTRNNKYFRFAIDTATCKMRSHLIDGETAVSRFGN